ncbi:relaxase/mobilization nuclease domain-containing protein, partial [Streptococcus suis]
MANIYARETALKNVVGRSDYISNPKRQEDIVLHKKEMKHTWKEYADFEKANQKSKNPNVQARETVVALPNDLAKDREKLEQFCDLLAKRMYGENRDYEYAVHWNQSRTNLHAHFIYSERERNLESKPKVYKRDLWADSKTGRTCKKDHPNAVLRAKKGEVMKDKDGNIKYDTEPFTAKDKR